MEWIIGVHPTFVLSWETIVVSLEILSALSVAIWMIYHRKSRDRLLLLDSDASPHTMQTRSPLLQPRPFCSLRMLLWYRVVVVIFFVFVTCFHAYRTRGQCFAFYTSWNFIGEAVYFIVAACQTYRLWKQQKRQDQPAYASLLEESGSFLHYPAGAIHRRGWVRLDLMLDLYLTTSILIGVVVWTILYPYARKINKPELLLNWVSYCQHGINILLLQIDFMSTRHTVSVNALPLVIAWPTVYTVFTWILHGTIAQGFWPYPFLQLDTPWAPLWYAGLLFAHLISFAMMRLLSRAKDSYEEVA